jgi:cell division protein FtsI/penicillin-binding protein 2
MSLFKRDHSESAQRPGWREYQRQLQEPAQRRYAPKRLGRRVIVSLVTVTIVLFTMYMSFSHDSGPRSESTAFSAGPLAPDVAQGKPSNEPFAANSTDGMFSKEKELNIAISKKDVQLLLNTLALNDLMAKNVAVPIQDQQFQIETSIDPDLQNKLAQALDRKHSRFVGVVVMEAATGRILSVAGFDKTDPAANPCFQSSFPAASLFKIVTAAAAIEHCNYSGDTKVHFNGYKHTLYKNQLKDVNNAWTQTTSFEDSFAQSINPVFGKIGTLHLGKRVLEEYGNGFGFNEPLDFELPIMPSHLAVDDTPYRWAEIASGFNKETTLSPVHAAVIVSAIVNQGRMVTPTLVERIVDAEGKEIYRSKATWQGRAMTTKTSAILADMMEATVQSGTGRAAFKNHMRDPVLSKLRIGGKTGSINNRTNDVRFDWFAGYAQGKDGSGRVVVSAMVAHEEYIGVRAGAYARMAIIHYFKNHLAQHELNKDKKKS